MQKVFVADIGRTHVRYGIASKSSAFIDIAEFQKLPNKPYYSFDLSLEKYLSSVDLDPSEIDAVFGVAGVPVINTVQVPNSDWFLDGNSIASKFGFKSVTLVNDFHAMARSVPELDESNYELIRKGTPDSESPVIVAGADTGLGVATLLPSDKKTYSVVSGEGGHSSYTPITKTEYELVTLLSKDFDHISVEMISSGLGYNLVYTALCEIFKRDNTKVSEKESFTLALDGDEMFQELNNIRASSLMSLAGDLVLINGARGGVVLTGNRSKHLYTYLKSPEALKRFENKGDKRLYLENCPIRLLNNEQAQLCGAAALHFQNQSE